MYRYVQFLHALKCTLSSEIWLFLFFSAWFSCVVNSLLPAVPLFAFRSPVSISLWREREVSTHTDGRAASVDSVAHPRHNVCSSRAYEFLCLFIFRRERENATPSLTDGKQLLVLCQTAALWWYFFLLVDPTLKFYVSQIDCKKAISTVGMKTSMNRTIFHVGIVSKLTFALFSKVKENKGSENACNGLAFSPRNPEIKMVCSVVCKKIIHELLKISF